jgi:hypothetical protein
MTDAVVNRAASWADALLAKVHRGPGDTIDAAMYRAESKYGIPAQTFWSLRYRPPKDILASVYLRLQSAYEAECAKQEAKLRHEIEMTKRVMGDAAPEALVREAEALVRKAGEA